MAESPSHKFGQLIGNLLEEVIKPFLADFAHSHNLYLDYQNNPRPVRTGKKVTWKDSYGNTHDLDYVLEQNGTPDRVGTPVAFIEVAWRRYTKHSRNKAQEIQGAILPLAEKFQWSSPFLGAVLAGEFTDGSLNQLRSLGFHVLYFPYETLVSAFGTQSIDIRFDERTSDQTFRQCVRRIEAASTTTMQRIEELLVAANKDALNTFVASLRERLDRIIEQVIIIPLYGGSNEFPSIDAALDFLDRHSIDEGSEEFRKYEAHVSFSNGNRVEGTFKEKAQIRTFLRSIASQ